MSIDHNLYLGCYISIPKCDWDELSQELEIEDEFMPVPRHPGVLTSNSLAVNLLNDDGEPQVLEFNEKLKAKAKMQFLEEHSETLEKLKKHFKKSIPIKFGLISYFY